ncbi:hypothetical protein EPA93_15560 [Ktedonosporobacter rubrisoli]|uniref:Uncharacterized protein n=1 Tax=Ktedonosporobacter rubrisoli TaxID=2509675 RepID=A0A4V0YYT4_KTERU|nr:hypothetical protein [Ktedonosporobacter rubrisoli]QBD74467.1 hypothetical protein EPA93_00035 [Ktedonosporobacter rubrisoli]QBD74471.1 hypothetical protein EPA93_00060 [Ktedonosporobacter rubrisoli]QBD77325.1 hypothetical protein EPA93_15530 [Ktedonosporobacter rubrisoli]QBD77331.1 hypothetical protein EPA93_15560 [Ktedonosporobacter rubrisoli]
MQVYWIKSPSEITPAVVKRQGRTYTWIAVFNHEKDQVEYLHIEKQSLQPRHVQDEIDEREATEVQQRTTRKRILGHH